MFKKESDLCKEYGYSPSTVSRYKREMEESGLFPDSIVGCGRGVRISEPAFHHFVAKRRLIVDPIARKYQDVYMENFK